MNGGIEQHICIIGFLILNSYLKFSQRLLKTCGSRGSHIRSICWNATYSRMEKVI